MTPTPALESATARWRDQADALVRTQADTMEPPPTEAGIQLAIVRVAKALLALAGER